MTHDSLRETRWLWLLVHFIYPSTCSCGWCFLFSLSHIFKYTTCFGPTGRLQVYNLVSHCRSFKVTATAAGSFVIWYCAAVHVFGIYCFRWANFLLFRCEAVLDVFVYSRFNLHCCVVDYLVSCYWLVDIFFWKCTLVIFKFTESFRPH
jgi:hypothetical protein